MKALQCISATTALRNFFISDQFVAEINRKNPLGKVSQSAYSVVLLASYRTCTFPLLQGGKFAESFAQLCKQLWFGGDREVTPTDFVRTLRAAQPQFANFEQHDSQEVFLSRSTASG